MKLKAYEKMKLQYRKLLEIGMTISLLFCVFIFQGSKRFVVGERVVSKEIDELKQIDVPLTLQRQKRQLIKKPVIPLLVDDDDIEFDPEDVVSIWDDIQFELPEQPDDPNIFVKVQKEPLPIGGFRAIANHLEYPKRAREMNLEGRVVIRAKIDEHGNVVRMLVWKSIGFKPFVQNAMKAIQAVKWEPALQRDQPVSVWVSIPIDFRLR